MYNPIHEYYCEYYKMYTVCRHQVGSLDVEE